MQLRGSMDRVASRVCASVRGVWMIYQKLVSNRVPMLASFSIRALIVALALAGCGPRALVSAEPDLGEVVLAWERALVEGRPRDAFALLSPDARDGLDEAGFVSLYERRRDALIDQAHDVARAVRIQRPDERAWVSVGEESYELVMTREGWRIVGPEATDPARATR